MGLIHDVGDLAVDVELQLFGRRVADAHRPRIGVAAQPRRLELRHAALAAQTVQNLDLARVAGDRPQQPAAPGERLFLETRVQQRDEDEGRVAQPAVAIVPVAHAAERLGQRGRGGGQHRAGACVGERLEGEQRAHHAVAPRPVVRARSRPLTPERVGAPQRRNDVRRTGLRLI